jgi:RNA polymerase sigma-70 factor (sigma-E family)
MESFDEYVAGAWQRLLRSAWLLTHDWHLAEDLLQTALVRVAPKWGKLADGAPDAYVRKVLATTYLSWWRRRWRAEVPTADVPEQVSPAADEVEIRTAVAGALASLPRQQRAVLMLRYHADLTEAATAAALGIGIGTVKSHTARALAALRTRPDLRGLLVEEGSR